MKGKYLLILPFLFLLAGMAYAQNGRNFAITTQREPEYPGGNEALYTFFYEKMEYPAEAKNRKLEGDVYVSFYVEPDSSVSEVSAMNDLGFGTKEEAIRLIKLCKFVPGVQGGKAVRMNMMVPVLFRIYE
jgi:protein TonB